ncbi:MAG: cation:proton antiporter [Planctomycetes bacterium]|nr:cation:proton antiporter [Planctomycetota bacterium]
MGHDIIYTFAGGMAAALVLGYVTQRIGLSPIVGYLLAGIAIGPHTPGFVANQAVAEQFAEIGIILLMFGVGLRFHLHELLAVWKVAVPGAVFQSLASTALAAVALHLMGWSWASAAVVGMAISVASTVVLVRVLSDNRDLHTRTGHVAVGWVVVEDLLTIGLLVVLPLLADRPALIDAAAASTEPGAGMAMLLALAKVVACVVLVVVGGGKVMPYLLERIAMTRSNELFILGVLAAGVGVAVAAAWAFDVSMALGAFLGGLVVGRSEFASRAAGEAMPMRDAFAVLFFVSVGMLFDPGHILAEPLLIAVVLAVVMLGKPLAAIAVVRLARQPWGMGLRVGATLGQVGEFTFILGTAARGLGLIDDRAWHTLIAVAMISIAANPTLYRFAAACSGRSEEVPQPLPEEAVQGDGHSILVGHGPVGQHVARALSGRGVPVTVIEMNLATVRALRAAGMPAVYGDASRLDTLQEAGLDRAATLVVSSDLADPIDIVRLARQRRPGLRVLVRCAHLRQVPALRAAGAEVVVAGEAEIAITLTESVLRQSGAAPESLAAVRDDVRRALGA